MRLTILNQFFYPDHSATSQLMTALAEDLAAQGVEVTALASQGSYNGGQIFASRESYRGVQIERVRATNFGKQRLPGRLSDYLTFYLGACWKLLSLPRQDVVMALTTPPLIGLVALLAGRLRGTRFVALQEDMYPDVAVALGALQERSLMARLLEWLTRLMLRHADRIIVLSDCMLERVVAKLGASARPRIDVIHNWADGREIVPLACEKARFFAERGLAELGEKFVVLFSGNLGLVNEFSTVLEAARMLREQSNVAFVFIGEGAKSAEIESFVSQYRLPNVFTLPYQPRADLCRSLAAGDALLVTLADGLAGLSVPSKTYSNLAAGRPLLFVGEQDSSIAALIAQQRCGVAVPSGASELLARTLQTWSANPALVAELGLRSRALFEQRFDRPHAVRCYLQSLQKCFAPAPQVALEDYSPIKTVNIKEPVS
jgi:glycosyltransferase involved in cell wall biosynthesis